MTKKAQADNSDIESNKQTKQKETTQLSKTTEKKTLDTTKKLSTTSAQQRPPSAEKSFRIKKNGTKPSNP